MIGIIGYGSLIWDLDTLQDKVADDWKRGHGPEMPVEFCRISPKRKMGLVLALDPGLPTVPTSIIKSRQPVLQDAVVDLAERERAPLEMIGFADRDGKWKSRHHEVGRQVRAWLRNSDYEAVVWTDLEANFHHETGNAFAHHTALAYLKTLGSDQLEEAWRYITFAPTETRTPFRGFLEQDDWWQRLSSTMSESIG